jgi:hypothetical protein
MKICEGLSGSNNNILKEFICKENKIQSSGMISLSNMMSRVWTTEIDPLCKEKGTYNQCICNINMLNLGWNDISEIGAIALSKAMKINTNLKNIDISANGVSDKATQVIASSLEVATSSIEFINLSQNRVSSPACFVFARILPLHKTMKALDLSLNPLGEPGSRSIFRKILNGLKCFVMMRSCTSLSSLLPSLLYYITLRCIMLCCNVLLYCVVLAESTELACLIFAIY